MVASPGAESIEHTQTDNNYNNKQCTRGEKFPDNISSQNCWMRVGISYLEPTPLSDLLQSAVCCEVKTERQHCLGRQGIRQRVLVTIMQVKQLLTCAGHSYC